MCRLLEEPPAAVLLPTSFPGVQLHLQMSTAVLIRAAAKSATFRLNQCLTASCFMASALPWLPAHCLRR